ncbi:hypothetical protein BGX26_003170, partial [Mortierella sp. AD094]
QDSIQHGDCEDRRNSSDAATYYEVAKGYRPHEAQGPLEQLPLGDKLLETNPSDRFLSKRREARDASEREMLNQDLEHAFKNSTRTGSFFTNPTSSPRQFWSRNARISRVVEGDFAQSEAELAQVHGVIVENPVSQFNIGEVCAALQAYYKPYLTVQRISGDKLDLESCYINLAIVEAPDQRLMDKMEFKANAATFHRMPSYEKIYGTNLQSTIPLEELFDERILCDGRNDVPKKILIQGRAGIGKTTLCKKLTHVYQSGLWRDHFEAVLWPHCGSHYVNLRRLKHAILRISYAKKYFAQRPEIERGLLVSALAEYVHVGKVLFILDGLDEILIDAQTEEGIALESFLRFLLGQNHVIITSRPSGVDMSILPKLDLELETVGFSEQNVNDYIAKVLQPEAAKAVRDYIQQTLLVDNLINIPVQLDVICYSWDSLPSNEHLVTMTGLYQTVVRTLWCKDGTRLKKISEEDLPLQKILRLRQYQIDQMMANEIECLGYLAFRGMQNNHQIEFDESTILDVIEELDGSRAQSDQEILPFQLPDTLNQTSFLHTADADLDPKKDASQRLLKGETLELFFDLLQEAPRDLIGGRHQQLSAACFNEARHRLTNRKMDGRLEAELMRWLHLEVKLQTDDKCLNILGSEGFFPEDLLIKSLKNTKADRSCALRALRSRCRFTSSTIEAIAHILQDPDRDIRILAMEALVTSSTLPRDIVETLIDILKDEDSGDPEDEEDYVRVAAITVLDSQLILQEPVIVAIIGALRDEDDDVRSSAVDELCTQPILPESILLNLIGALKSESFDFRNSALEVLCAQTTLPAPAIQALVGSIQEEDDGLKNSVIQVLRTQSTLFEPPIQVLVAAPHGEEDDTSGLAFKAIDAQADGNEDQVMGSTTQAPRDKAILSESEILNLIDVLDDDKYSFTKESAIESLRAQSVLPESAVLAMIDTLHNEDEEIRNSAVKAIRIQLAF